GVRSEKIFGHHGPALRRARSHGRFHSSGRRMALLHSSAWPRSKRKNGLPALFVCRQDGAGSEPSKVDIIFVCLTFVCANGCSRSKVKRRTFVTRQLIQRSPHAKSRSTHDLS